MLMRVMIVSIIFAVVFSVVLSWYKYNDLIIFLWINFFISKIGIYLKDYRSFDYIVIRTQNGFSPSKYYLIFLIIVSCYLLVKKKQYKDMKRVIFIILITLDTYMFVYIGFISFLPLYLTGYSF
ncbi:hypothetical protein M2092_002399 [Fusobacterium sp. PH5-44]